MRSCIGKFPLGDIPSLDIIVVYSPHIPSMQPQARFEFPDDIMIEVTNDCNLKCTTCYSHQDGRKRLYMEFELYKRIIDAIPDKGAKTLSLYNYGEPLMHKEIGKFVQYAKEAGIGFVKIATNGTFLTLKKSIELIKSGLDYISISVDGADQATYSKFRIGGSLENVLQNIARFTKLKKKVGIGPIVEMQFIIMAHNEQQIQKIATLASLLGVDRLRYKTVLIKNKIWSHLLPKEVQYSRYTDHKMTTCAKPKNGIVINVDGLVIPCCYMTDKYLDIHAYGRLDASEDIQHIFMQPRTQDLIAQITTDKTKVEYCNTCQEGNLDLNYGIIDFSL